MKLLLGLALAVLPALAESPGARSAPFTLYTEFQQAPPPAVLNALHEELASIMSPIGLAFEWRSLPAAPGDVSFDLAVIRFRGKCSPARLSATPSLFGALGVTHVSGGVVLLFSDIDCDGIRNFVQRGLLRVAERKREEALGRAVARVLAHELYHIITGARRHGSAGVGKSSHTSGELLSKVFNFEERETEALRAWKAPALLEIASAGQ